MQVCEQANDYRENGTRLKINIFLRIDHPALHGLWYVTGATTFAAAVSYIVSKDTYKIIKESRKLKGRKVE